MTEQTVASAVAKTEQASTPSKLIEVYRGDFAQVLPTHINPDTWVRVTQGALRRGQRVVAPNSKDPMHAFHGQFLLQVAAMSNTSAFLVALLDAARQGLEPGTEQYYLTPRRIKGRWEILGITGYQGYIELMYRSGAVRSVVAELVRANDTYRYVRGRDHMPVHEFNPFASTETRGEVVGVYAYALLTNNAVSRVIEYNLDDIARIRARSPSAASEKSPWHTDWDAMALKCPVRALRKWVPTSPEWRSHLMEQAAKVQAVVEARDLPPLPDEDTVDGEVVDGDQGIDSGGASMDDAVADDGWAGIPVAQPPQ